jgi:hypothetical protein
LSKAKTFGITTLIRMTIRSTESHDICCSTGYYTVLLSAIGLNVILLYLILFNIILLILIRLNVILLNVILRCDVMQSGV